MKKLILTLSMLSLPIQAQKAERLEKGTPAPYTGVLLDEKAAEEARKSDQLVPLLQERVNILENSNKILMTQYDLWKTQAEKSAQKAEQAQDRWVMGVLIGIALTVGASYTLKQVSK
jgi:hypothetical protein